MEDGRLRLSGLNPRLESLLLLYYITDRTQFPGDETARQGALLQKIAEASRCGVDLIQLREKDLSTRQLEALAGACLRVIRENSPQRIETRKLTTRLLINSRTDVAMACGADGVHLRSDDISSRDLRRAWKCGAATGETNPLIGRSCHTSSEVVHAAQESADFVVFAPVFEKKDTPGTLPAGLMALREACRQNLPVLALGGITLANARSCLEAGAAGIAAIRLFQGNDFAQVVKTLRG